jgi:hypothetical protein
VPTLHALVAYDVLLLAPTFAVSTRAAREPSLRLSPQRLSVVRRL